MAVASLRKLASPLDVASAVDLLRSHTLVSVTQDELERLILDGELKMGERVNELGLATRLNVSRGPIREACRALVQAGLLETKANRGFFVRKLALKEVSDLYDLRAGLMRLAGELVAGHIDEDALHRLEACVDAMDVAQREGDAERFRDLNSEFHAQLVHATDNHRLVAIYGALVKELRLFRRRGLVSADALHLSNEEHRAIVEAIAARDTERAATAMQHHILQGKARFLAAVGGQLDD
jgi:DNA-binding GntR family transcriptional regulator